MAVPVPFRLAVVAHRRTLALDGGAAEGGDHGLGVGRGHLDEAVSLEQRDGADLMPAQVRLTGDGADQIAGADACGLADADEELRRGARRAFAAIGLVATIGPFPPI